MQRICSTVTSVSLSMTCIKYAPGIERIAQWNKFVAAYGAYFYYSNPAYLITDYVRGDFTVSIVGIRTMRQSYYSNEQQV